MDEAPRGGRALYCLIGGDVTLSPSPLIMKKAFSVLSINARYLSLSLEGSNLATKFAELKRKGLRGMNVTMPFKTTIVPLLDGLDQVSSRIDAVNVVKKVGDLYLGFNTDVNGIAEPLKRFDTDRKIEHAVVIGAGGAARAFVEVMHRSKCRKISVIVREPKRAENFIEKMKRAFPEMSFQLCAIEGSKALTKAKVDLLFNATPIGSPERPLPETIHYLVKSGCIVFDAMYRPKETELITVAKKADCEVIYGYEMLLYQATASFELWTGVKAPTEAMRISLLDFLEDGKSR